MKGRPELPKEKRKRHHYSVWLTEIQKTKIDERIASSNLSASQYILEQLELNNVKRPSKRNLPNHISQSIIHLEKLSGLLAFYAHRTKDRELVSTEWVQASKLVRKLSEVIVLWIFEEFEILKIKEKVEGIILDLEKVQSVTEIQADSDFKGFILESLQGLISLSNDISKSYNSYYELQNFDLGIYQTKNDFTSKENLKEDFKRMISEIYHSL